MDRRTTIQWMLAASASIPLLQQRVFGADTPTPPAAAKGYGTDPDLTKDYHPGDIWPPIVPASASG